jgi:hypothetical protein
MPRQSISNSKLGSASSSSNSTVNAEYGSSISINLQACPAILKQILGIGSRAVVVFYPTLDLPGILLVDGSDAGGVSCAEGKQMVFLAHKSNLS